MTYYQFTPDDQQCSNWLLFEEKSKFGDVAVKSAYREFVCERCMSIAHDRAFAVGFEKGAKVRAKGDFFFSSDGFLCVSEKVKQVIDSLGYGGLVLKIIPDTKWYVVNVTLRVDADQGAYTGKNRCNVCDKARQYGRIICLVQIDAPQQSGVFFTPVFDRGGSTNAERDFFATEDIVAEFKRQGLKGGLFSRLLTPSELEAVKAARAEFNPSKWPKGSHVFL
jgi:hypothetical protein